MKKIWLALVLLMVAAAHSGCSFRGMAIRNLDWIAARYLEDLFSPDPEQEKDLQAGLETCFASLRKEYIPRLRANVLSLRVKVAEGLGRRDIEEAYDGVIRLYEEFLSRESPAMGRFLSTLGEQQIAAFEKNREEHHRKHFDEEREEANLDHHARRMRKRMEGWIGPLEGEQRLLVEAFSAERLQAEMRLKEETLRWQRELVSLLRSRPGSEALAAHITGAGVSPFPLRPAAYREEMAARRSAWVEFLSALDATLSSRQRRHLESELDSLAGDLDLPG